MIEKPPFTITADILSLVERIGEAIGRAEAAGVSHDARVRRINRIRTIRGTLAIEGNTLSEEEISMILDGKPVAALPGVVDAELLDTGGVQHIKSRKRIPLRSSTRPSRETREWSGDGRRW